MQSTIPANMLTAATEALQHAYCPYSNYPVAACVMAKDGSLFSSCNVENAAFNLCSCAETNALCQLVAAGHRSISACLVITPTDTLVAPCGACRQRLMEFSVENIPIYLCSTKGHYQIQYLRDLLPSAFGPNNLETS